MGNTYMNEMDSPISSPLKNVLSVSEVSMRYWGGGWEGRVVCVLGIIHILEEYSMLWASCRDSSSTYIVGGVASSWVEGRHLSHLTDRAYREPPVKTLLATENRNPILRRRCQIEGSTDIHRVEGVSYYNSPMIKEGIREDTDQLYRRWENSKLRTGDGSFSPPLSHEWLSDLMRSVYWNVWTHIGKVGGQWCSESQVGFENRVAWWCGCNLFLCHCRSCIEMRISIYYGWVLSVGRWHLRSERSERLSQHLRRLLVPGYFRKDRGYIFGVTCVIGLREGLKFAIL